MLLIEWRKLLLLIDNYLEGPGVYSMNWVSWVTLKVSANDQDAVINRGGMYVFYKWDTNETEIIVGPQLIILL